jgi:dTDP-4-amino-4,6-dideoxy-D-glucose acyltransferase
MTKQEASKYKSLGLDVYIHDTVEITRPHLATIGHHSAIDFNFYCTVSLDVGDYVHIAPHCSAIGGAHSSLEIDDFSWIAVGTNIVCGSEDYTGSGLVGPNIPKEYQADTFTSTVRIDRFAGTGAGCTIMPGVRMAEGSILGAHSLLTKDTEPWTIYVGSPAKPVKVREKETIIKYAKEMGYVY